MRNTCSYFYSKYISGPTFDDFLRKTLLAFDNPKFDNLPHADKDYDIRDMHDYAGLFLFLFLISITEITK